MMVLTVLEAQVPAGGDAALQAAYERESAQPPEGLVRSELVRDSGDASRWRIQTWWASREALMAMRRVAGTPAGVRMFREAGAEPTLAIFDVVSVIPPGHA